jgi:phosphohistidine phosphatase
MRHAKSDWNGYYVSDFERTLNKRGLKAAPLMGEVLNAKISPDLIVSSPATRAKMTAEAVAQKLGYPQEKIVFVERIYEASAADLLRIIHRLPKDADEVLMVGHNPGMTELINALSEDFRLENLPTAGVVGMAFAVREWSKVAPKQGSVLFYEYPKKYHKAD